MIFKKFQLIFTIIALSISISSVLAVSDTIEVNQQVIQGVACNYNGICEPAFGENENNCPSDCAVQGGGGSYPLIYNVSIDKITLNSAEISWETNRPALCQLLWGQTQEYEKEVISEAAFYWRHSTSLINLLSGTAYHFKIECRDTYGVTIETNDQIFSTLFPLDITPPANVINFEAISGDSQIALRWENPPDADFKGVKIMRSEEFYPANPWEGTPVYDDKGTSFLDAGLVNGQRYYYTAFAYDKAGNYASGAVASAVPSKEKPAFPPEQIMTEKECQESGYYWYDNSCHEEPELLPPPPEIEELKLEDFDFFQKGIRLPLIERNKIEFEKEEPLTVSIDYEKVPEVLKTIMVTLKKEGKTFSFFLRVNPEKTVYQAAIVPPEPGTYPLILTVLDYKNQALKKIFGQLTVIGTQPLSSLRTVWQKEWKTWLYIFGAILISAVLIFLLRKKLKKKNEKIKIGYES
jgi:hypothetical protein